MALSEIKLLAFDLDGTLTQHKCPLGAENRRVLDALGRRYALVMVGAGMCHRVFRQMGAYPIDIIGNYGMQVARYDRETGQPVIIRDVQMPCDRPSVEARVTALREAFGYTAFTGDNVEYHTSGCVTFPILGTEAALESKLAFDPDRCKRRAHYKQVQETFPEYTVFVGGSSSFDMVPRPYDKYSALSLYCQEHGYSHSQVVYIGDDYGLGGNDEPVYRSDFHFLTIDDYRTFPQVVQGLLEGSYAV